MIIREVIEKIIDQKIVLAILKGTVNSISDQICTVKLDLDGVEMFKVSLTPTLEQKEDHLIFTPKIGSLVTLGVYPDGENATILSVSEVDTVQYKKATTEFKINDQGFEIKRENENLKNVLNDFIDEVNKIVVVNGTSINVGATTAIQERLNKILQ